LSPTLKGIALKIASTLAFAVMVTLIKLVSDQVPPGEVLFARASIGTIPVVVMLLVQGEFGRALVTHKPFGHMKRAVFGTMSMFCWFASLVWLPLADATAINYAGPLFGVIFAALLLGERVRAYRWTAVGVGFAGVLIVLSDHVSGVQFAADGRALGALLALASAVFAAVATVMVRGLTATETTGAIVFYFSISAAAMSLISLPFGWVVPTLGEAGILVAAGLCGGIGQVLMTSGYRYAEASVAAPFDYASMIWIVVLAYAVFGDVPTSTVMLGSLIVIGSGVFVMWHEHKLGILEKKAFEREAGTPI
jgi:drug/metabolite transporter (DMT)-like permease